MNTVHFDTTRATGPARCMVRTLVEAGVFTLATSQETADHVVTVSVQDALFADIYTNDYARGEFVSLGPHAIINVRPHLSEEDMMATVLHEAMHLLQHMEGTFDPQQDRAWGERDCERDAVNRALNLAEANEWRGLYPALRRDARNLA